MVSLCFDGLRKAPALPTTTTTVAPAGSAPVALAAAQTVKLTLSEMMFTKTPLAMASYPALAFRLAQASPEALKSSLSAALADHPMMAGRMHDGGIALTHEGVPFTVVQSPENSAPEVIEELQLLQLTDFRRPARMMKGLEPLMTVKLTLYRDGSAVLGMCRSHALLDGTSAWAFLNNWARHARGEAGEATRADRDALLAAIPTDSRLEELAHKILGKPLSGSWLFWAVGKLMPVLSPPYDWAFLSGITGDLTRPRVCFSDGELARIKAAATPPKGSAGDGWVSTQEALAAYLLVTVAGATLPETSKGRTAVVFLLDARKALRLRSSHCFGSGVVFQRVNFTGILQKSLVEVASILHEASKTEFSPEAIRDQWQLFAGAAEKKQEFAAMEKAQPMPSEFDIRMMFNNQSKRQLPDFGPEGSGGQAQAVVTNAGPTLVLPRPGGVEVFLDKSGLLGPAKTAEKRKAALEALRSSIPKAVEGTALGTSDVFRARGA